MSETYDADADPVHGSGWNSAARWGGWDWRAPRGAQHYRTCSFCGSIHPEDLAAETAGTGTCKACGGQGWEACFRKQPTGASRQVIERLLADPSIPDEEKQRLRGEHPAHSYDPGGWYASWADRKYGWPHKFYVEGLVNRHPEILRIITACTQAQWDEAQRALAEGRPAFGVGGGYRWYAIADIPEGTDVSGWGLEEGHYSHVGLGSDATHHAKFYTIHLADPAISDEARETIQRVSGLRFTFDGGRIGWQPAWPA